jgi:GNAT superfamily N-acetyltransferase
VTTAARTEPGDDTSRGAHDLRPATVDDLPTCAAIWRDALNDYLGRLAQPEIPDDLGPILRLYGHLQSTDPTRFVAAERSGSNGAAVIDGFGAALVRDGLWFLSMLFVRPTAQGRGLGRRLLDAIGPEPGWEARGGVRATATDSVQPISNGLYASLGIVPRVPLLRLVGRAERPAALPPLPEDIDITPFDEVTGDGDGLGASALDREIAALDRDGLGFERPLDHRFLAAEGRHGFLYCDRTGRPRGYGYTSESGRVGPVVVAESALLGPVVGHLVTAIEPRGAFGAWVPGSAEEAVVPLLRSGFRIDGFPVLLCWDRPFADFSRALPISPGLL